MASLFFKSDLAHSYTHGYDGAGYGWSADLVWLCRNQKERNWKGSLFRACRRNDVPTAHMIINCTPISVWHANEYAARGACYGGHIELLEQFVNPNTNYSELSYSAGLGGHMKSVLWLEKQGHAFYDDILRGAIERSRMDIFKYAAEKILRRLPPNKRCTFIKQWLSMTNSADRERAIAIIESFKI